MGRPGGPDGGGEMCNVDKKRNKKSSEYFDGLITGVLLGMIIMIILIILK